MSRARYVLVMAGLLAGLAIVVASAIAFSGGGRSAEFPSPLEDVRPRPGDVVTPQAGLLIDLPTGYEPRLEIDGMPIPSDELEATEAIGVFRWSPAPARTIESWEPGEHEVTVHWDRIDGGRPDPGSFSWVFRIA